MAASSPVSSAYLATSPRPDAHSRARERGEHGGVAEDPEGLVERPDEVLALRQVDGRLAADRGVDLAEERGGHLDERDAAEVHRGDEARDVGDHPAAEAHDDVAARHAFCDQLAAEPLDGRQRLRALALGDDVERGVDAGVEALEPALVDDALLGHDGRGAAPWPARRDQGRQPVA